MNIEDITLDDLIQLVEDKEITAFNLGCYLSDNPALSLKICVDLCGRLGVPVNDNNLLALQQYFMIAFQAVIKNISFKDAVLNYEYPDNLPNLSVDITENVQITPEGVYYAKYDETAPLPLSLVQNGDTFRMSPRLVVINERQVIKMD